MPQRVYPILAVAAVMALMVPQCNLPVVESDPGEMPYRTQHFALYYDSTELSIVEIEEIGLHKEYLLDHVNAYLGVAYDGVMVCIISDTVDRSHASSYGVTYETVGYARADDGHEMAHIVSRAEWGRCARSFLVEGIAVAAQVYEEGTALTHYAARVARGATDLVASMETEKEELADALTEGNFDYSFQDYQRAGGFVHYVWMTYGRDCTRAWYTGSPCVDNESRQQCLEKALSVTLADLLNDFAEEAIRLGAGG